MVLSSTPQHHSTKRQYLPSFISFSFLFFSVCERREGKEREGGGGRGGGRGRGSGREGERSLIELDYKRSTTRKLGMSLIVIPCWWDGTIQT